MEVPYFFADPVRLYGPYGNLKSLLKQATGRSGSCEYALPSGIVRIAWETSAPKSKLEFHCLHDADAEVLGQWESTVGVVHDALEVSFAVPHEPFVMLGTHVAFHTGAYLWRIEYLTSLADAQYERGRLEKVLRTVLEFAASAGSRSGQDDPYDAASLAWPVVGEGRVPPGGTAASAARSVSQDIQYSPMLLAPRPTALEGASLEVKDGPRNLDFSAFDYKRMAEVPVRGEGLKQHISDLLSFWKWGEIEAPYLNRVNVATIEKILRMLIRSGVVSGTCETALEEQSQCFRAAFRVQGLSRNDIVRKRLTSPLRLDNLLDNPVDNMRVQLKTFIRVAAELGTPLFGISASPKGSTNTFRHRGVKLGCARENPSPDLESSPEDRSVEGREQPQETQVESSRFAHCPDVRFEEIPPVPTKEISLHVSDLLAFQKEKIHAPYLRRIHKLSVDKVLKVLIDIGDVSGTCEAALHDQSQVFRAALVAQNLSREDLSQMVKISQLRIESFLDTPGKNKRAHLQTFVRIAVALNTPLFGISANVNPNTFVFRGAKLGCAREQQPEPIFLKPRRPRVRRINVDV